MGLFRDSNTYINVYGEWYVDHLKLWFFFNDGAIPKVLVYKWPPTNKDCPFYYSDSWPLVANATYSDPSGKISVSLNDNLKNVTLTVNNLQLKPDYDAQTGFSRSDGKERYEGVVLNFSNTYFFLSSRSGNAFFCGPAQRAMSIGEDPNIGKFYDITSYQVVSDAGYGAGLPIDAGLSC